jgi:hypothetical protein
MPCRNTASKADPSGGVPAASSTSRSRWVGTTVGCPSTVAASPVTWPVAGSSTGPLVPPVANAAARSCSEESAPVPGSTATVIAPGGTVGSGGWVKPRSSAEPGTASPSGASSAVGVPPPPPIRSRPTSAAVAGGCTSSAGALVGSWVYGSTSYTGRKKRMQCSTRS